MFDESKFYSLEEVAEMLGVTYQLIYKLVRTGELGALRVGKMYRVTGKDINDYLNRQREVVKKEAVAMTCSVCGNSYFSAQSIVAECKICKRPICCNCWELDHAEYCREHAKEKKEK